MRPKAIEDLLERYQSTLSPTKTDGGGAKIHVDEIASKVAVFYERVRSIIDYQEEHLLRKNFIGRILRRRLLIKDLTTNRNIAEPLIKEVIRAGRLPNDSVPETKIAEVQGIIDNFYKLAEELRKLRDPREKAIYDWLVKITTSAVEENLFPPAKDTMLAELMFWTIKENFSAVGADLKEEEINLQLFIGIQKAMLRVDEDQLNYRLLKFTYHDWNNSHGDKAQIAKDLAAIKERLWVQQRHPLGSRFFKLCNKYNTVFYLIGDMLDKGLSAEALSELLGNEKALEREIRAAYNKRYEKQRSRLHRMAFFSVISIFLSKIVVALAIEVPIDKYITNNFSIINLILNIAIPSFLMLIIVLSIKMPSDKNLTIVWKEVRSVVGSEGPRNYVVYIPRKKSFFTRFLLRSLYFGVFFYSFYYLTQILLSLHFSAANIIIFAFFTSLVAATGVKIHNRSKELNMEDKKPKFLMFLVDIFALPFITVGKWGLAALSRMNILVIIFNLLIELPFQFVIEFVENFRAFIKREKEDLH